MRQCIRPPVQNWQRDRLTSNQFLLLRVIFLFRKVLLSTRFPDFFINRGGILFADRRRLDVSTTPRRGIRLAKLAMEFFQHRHAPPAARARGEAIGYFRCILRFFNLAEGFNFLQAYLETETDCVVGP